MRKANKDDRFLTVIICTYAVMKAVGDSSVATAETTYGALQRAAEAVKAYFEGPRCRKNR